MTTKARPSEAIFWGGAAVAILDIANAMTFWAVYNARPHDSSCKASPQACRGGTLFQEAPRRHGRGHFFTFSFPAASPRSISLQACAGRRCLRGRYSMAWPMESSSISS